MDGRDVLSEIIEERTTNYGYIDCNEKGEAFLHQIEGVDINSYLCAYDSSYAMEGYVAAIEKIGKSELASNLSDILTGDIETEDELSLADQIKNASSEKEEPSTADVRTQQQEL